MLPSSHIPDDPMTTFATRHDLRDWEDRWSPYDAATYQAVIDAVGANDVVLDIGAGDLRLALALAVKAQRVYAIEVNPHLVATALAEIGYDLPRNLSVICANALDFSFPPDVTLAVLLMRHCQHVAVYIQKLRVVGCPYLVTNARWGMGVEMVDLTTTVPWPAFTGGWYACLCGAVGYKPPTPPVEAHEGDATVETCPACVLA